MSAARILKQTTREMFRPQVSSDHLSRLPRTSRLTTGDQERREVLESVRGAMRQKTMEPACRAACHFLLQHLTR
jgi:hypothetical protein